MPLKLRRFLIELLDLLKEDYPKQLRDIIRNAKGLVYLQVLDSEKAIVRVGSTSIKIEGKAKKSEVNVRVYLTRDCLFRILEGRLTLEEAIRRDELTVFGDPQMILKCYGMWEKVISLARSSPRFYFHTYRLRQPVLGGSGKDISRAAIIHPV
jgi:hypothetical protein